MPTSDSQTFIMKTEASNADVIWTSTMELSQLAQEECFPVIGSCQVSSILSNLDAADKLIQTNPDIPETMDLIVLQNNDFKITTETDLTNQIPNDFILLKDNADNTQEHSNNNDNTGEPDPKKSSKKVKRITADNDFENMLYFVCNLCPYLCIKDSKITEHLESEHKSKACNSKPLQLKCPACPNIFYHKVPLRSHLIHDHQVGNADLQRIIQAVIYFSKKSLNNSSKSGGDANKDEMAGATVNCKNEMDLKYVQKLINTEKIINNDESMSNDTSEVEAPLDSSSENNLEKMNVIEESRCKDLENAQEIQLPPEIVSLPMIDITHNDAEKTFGNIIKKRPDSLTKYLDQKKLHKCTVALCKVRLQDSTKMAYHIKCHTKGTFKCPECHELFAFWKPLTGHLWRLHNIDMELYSCDRCDYKTFSLGKLNNIHKLIHSDLKAFVCDVCRKGFKNTKQLRNHKMTHKEKSDKLTHICDVCAKAFADRRQLKVHMDGVHKKIKPFLCSYCGYKGASKSALKMHVRQHTGEKPFVCDACDYTTADHNSLRRHKLRHTGFKPYKCAHCDYACIQSSTYKVHLRTKHPGLEKDLLFTCQECQFRTVNQDMYLSHLFLVHKQKTDIT